MSIEQKVKRIIAEIGENQIFKLNPVIMPNDCIISVDFAIESISFIEMIAQIEDKFEIEISHEEIDMYIEVGKLVELVENKVFEGVKNE